MGHPYKRLIIPSEMQRYTNGKLPAETLGKLSMGGTAWRGGKCGGAVFAFNLMYDHAKRDGIKLVAISEGYRSYERQVALFLDRYSSSPTDRVPTITRIWQGRTYWLRSGKSPSATPATSPHGFGLAQDINVNDGRVYKWLCDYAPVYGIYLQGPPKYLWRVNPEYEAWHWQLSDADNPTATVQRAWQVFIDLLAKGGDGQG